MIASTIDTTPETLTAKITKNSFWGTMSFAVASITNFIISVEITRYFGRELYGEYSYFLWLASTISLFAGFGLNQGITKYLPRYFFEKDGIKKADILIENFFSFQIAAGCIFTILFIVGIPFFRDFMPFDQDTKILFLWIAIFCIGPLTVNNFFTTSLAATQQFKKLSILQMIFAILNGIGSTFLVFSGQSLTNFLYFFLGINFLSGITYMLTLNNFFRSKKLLGFLEWKINNVVISPRPDEITPEKEKEKSALSATLPWKEIITYNAWNYLGTIFGQITWERSEFFFLGLYSNSTNLGIYALSYSLAILFIGLFGPITNILNNITAEAIGTNKKDHLSNICEHASKYMAIITLPSIILGTLFLENIITMFYGKNFSEAAYFFPFLVLSHTLAIIVTPASNVAYFKNEVRRMTFFTILTGIINISLDIILIPRYQLIGAVAANTLAQLFSITVVLINARKYNLKIFNKEMLKVMGINILLGLGIFGILYTQTPLIIKIPLGFLAAISYTMLIIKFSFNTNDLGILENLVKTVPVQIQNPARFFLEKIRENVKN